MPSSGYAQGIGAGVICWAKFPYSDCSDSKVRPVVVLKRLNGNDAIVCMITSADTKSAFSIHIDAKDMKSGRIKPCIVRPDKLFTGQATEFEPIGFLNNDKFSEIINIVIGLFR